MIKHIVMWRLKENALGSPKEENAAKMIKMLSDLKGIVPGLVSIEAGRDFSNSDKSFDVALYSEFKTKEALDAYQIHPEHLKVKDFVSSVVSDRAVVDYEV